MCGEMEMEKRMEIFILSFLNHMKKTLVISKQEGIIYIQRQDGNYEQNPEIKLFTYKDGIKIMTEIAIAFLEPKNEEKV